jgi:hypothetical protein
LSDSAESGTDPFARPKYLVNERTWTNADGRKLVAALISLDGEEGKFRFTNGREFDYDISKLSTDDQELIQSKSGSETEEEEEEEDEEEEENKFDF